MKNRISEEEFEEKYKPQQNHIVGGENASFNGWMYETFGPELEYVISMVRNPSTANRVWTIIEGDGGQCICANMHIVNRMGYIITEKPFSNPQLWVQFDDDFE